MKKMTLLLLSIVALSGMVSARENVVYSNGLYEMSFFGGFKPEMFFANNVSLLNNANGDLDRIWYARHTLDLKSRMTYRKPMHDIPSAELFFSVRDKAIWGNAATIATTTDAEIKLLDALQGSHSHALPRHIFWIQEAWLKLRPADVFGLNLTHRHEFILGAFPFELGRGIALGSAYAVGQELLGFWSDGLVDQYAFGANLGGDLINDRLSYDLYAAILRNRTATLGDVNAKVFGQQVGRIASPARGFGSINYVLAAKLGVTAFESSCYGKLTTEPYIMYNSDPEQTVEFASDASSKLGTLGFAAEYAVNRWEFGFDTAVNFGQQRVRAWDRNQVQLENRDGNVLITNSHVVDQDGNRVLFIKTDGRQTIIDSTFESSSQNGKKIGSVGGTDLINADDRYRDAYTNKYRGWMLVSDAAVWLYQKDLKLAVTAGIATGDANPNNEEIDGRYDGFIGLQEVYAGKRVRSAFLLGGAGRLKRILAKPAAELESSDFAETVSGFTDLIFAGTGLTWKPALREHPFSINPNILAYWKDEPANKYDAIANKELPLRASPFLGVEANIFASYSPMPCLNLFCVGSIFFGGQHYTDIKGKPLNAAQQKLIDQLDRTGYSSDPIPNIGDDRAFTFNLGVEYKF